MHGIETYTSFYCLYSYAIHYDIKHLGQFRYDMHIAGECGCMFEPKASLHRSMSE